MQGKENTDPGGLLEPLAQRPFIETQPPARYSPTSFKSHQMPAQRTASGRISRTFTRPKANSEITLKPPKSSARRTTYGRKGKASTVPKAKATTKAISFFHLPVELRVQIYRQHLVRPYLTGDINRLRPKDIAIFQANRQIYNEAINIFYK